MTELEKLRNMVGVLLAKQWPTPEVIRTEIGNIRKLFSTVSDEDAERLALEFEHIHGVTMEIGSALEDPGFEKWLDSSKANIDFYYWERYRSLLIDKDFSAQVLATLDSVTDRTLGLLGNPQKEGKWDRRGMVVGHVQSGKTANYIGLVSKAADAGYRVIVIIAGLHNNLRSQTQARLDEGFTGFDSSKLLNNRNSSESIIGVGCIDFRRRPNAFTNTHRDFNKQTATSIGIPLNNLNEPAVFVIKKNTNTLRNLLDWLKEHNAKRGESSIDAPMLLIDDEADNASINISKGRDEVSRINGQIRQLLDVFDRSCYVGYTATPFANIFIDPDSDDEMFGEDLFPRDFIVSLDPPDNYFGASRVFLPNTEDDDIFSIVRHVEDSMDLLPLKHRKDHVISALPDSLNDAVRTFIVARTIRLIRKHETSHNSMLVNVSRFTNVQRQIRNEIHNLLYKLKSNIRINGALPFQKAVQDSEIAALKRIFDIEYGSSAVTWSEVQTRLWESISPIKVIEVNSRSSEALDYEDHKVTSLNVIAVGGFSLSRGLTLEGLTVSYFLRNSMMYDTLMQMGRWFGYRPGFDDLCRVWMSEEAEGWYSHIAESIEELREELRRMEVAKATPKDFGLKVRSHPDTLIVTARNKMGSGKNIIVKIGLANQFVETAILRRDEESTNANRLAAITLARSIQSAGIRSAKDPSAGGKLFKDVSVSIVTDFLSSFLNHQASLITEIEPIKKYIDQRSGTELLNWDVFFPGLQQAKKNSLVDSSLGFELVCQRRIAGRRRSDDRTLYITEKQRVSSRGIEKVGLSPNEIRKVEFEYRNQVDPQNTGKSLNYPDRIYRRVRKRPLLVVHLLAIGEKDEDLRNSKPVIAWSISFPQTGLEEERVEYLVNTTWFSEHFREEEDEEDAGGDNE